MSAPPSRHPLELPDRDLLRECTVRRLRRGGPGGQHRNKVETAVQLIHGPTGTTAEASERRSQIENQETALQRLRLQLALTVRTPRPAGSMPSPLWRQRCRDGRIAINPRHSDFPLLLAEALDVIAEHAWNVSTAAASLDCTGSQLVKLLQLEPRALAVVNRQRAALGLKSLQ